MVPPPAADRVLGRGSLTALVINSIVGSGVFVLPGTIAGILGWQAMGAWGLAAALIGTMIGCFAEVASRFTGAGGAYRYTQAAFGPFVGIQVAWLTYFARCVSAAAQANLFTTSLAEFFPWAATRAGSVLLATGFIGTLAAINIRGTGAGARTSNAFAVVKVAALTLFAIAGIAFLLSGHAVALVPPADATVAGWRRALLLLVFAYGGFEGAVIPLGEARDPQKDAPVALLGGFAIVIVLFLGVQLAVLALVADPAAAPRPLAAAARALAGGPGAVAMTVLVLASVLGWMASNMLNMPRLTAAMAHDGVLPAVLGASHARYRTPWASILLFAGVSLGLALSAGLLQNVSLAAVARLFPYAGVCLTVVSLRRREARGLARGDAQPARFRLPAGSALGVLGFVCALLLVSSMNQREFWSMVVIVALAGAHWAASRRSAARVAAA
ncbi:MAG: APC family permease [Gemmatimonadetes bacterium]|nr:APC family permease [Gemmatimonadota bacterium]